MFDHRRITTSFTARAIWRLRGMMLFLIGP